MFWDGYHVLFPFQVMRGQARVKHFFQYIAEQNASERDPHDGQARRQVEPPRAIGHRTAVEGKVEHGSPRWLGRVTKPRNASPNSTRMAVERTNTVFATMSGMI